MTASELYELKRALFHLTHPSGQRREGRAIVERLIRQKEMTDQKWRSSRRLPGAKRPLKYYEAAIPK